MKRAVSGLYAVTPETGDIGYLTAMVEAVLRGGARVVQYRSKIADGSKRRMQAGEIVRLCRGQGAISIVNDSVELALEVGADGVHLGRDDGELRAARELLGAEKLIGASCYNELARAREAIALGADYVAFGSFFASTTKPGVAHASLDLLKAAKRELSIPVVAIGGIDADNAGRLVAAGADAVAVVGALFDATNVENEARRLARLFEIHRHP